MVLADVLVLKVRWVVGAERLEWAGGLECRSQPPLTMTSWTNSTTVHIVTF